MAADLASYRIAVLTVSDTRNEHTDRSGPVVVRELGALGFAVYAHRFCIDEQSLIASNLMELGRESDAVFTTGGTGFATRDVTPEATCEVIDRRADSLVELMRLRGLEKTPFSHLSRGVAGIRGSTLIVNLPGSPAGAAEGIQAIGHLLEPILAALSGDACPVKPQQPLP